MSAHRLRHLLAHRGLEIGVYTLTAVHKDAGDYAEDNPLGDIDKDAAREFAADLETEGLLGWEAVRLSVLGFLIPK